MEMLSRSTCAMSEPMAQTALRNLSQLEKIADRIDQITNAVSGRSVGGTTPANAADSLQQQIYLASMLSR